MIQLTDSDTLRGTLIEERSDGWVLDEESGRLIHVYSQEIDQIISDEESEERTTGWSDRGAYPFGRRRALAPRVVGIGPRAGGTPLPAPAPTLGRRTPRVPSETPDAGRWFVALVESVPPPVLLPALFAERLPLGESPDAQHGGFVLAAFLARAPANTEIEGVVRIGHGRCFGVLSPAVESLSAVSNGSTIVSPSDQNVECA
jgi:hypothetical protein